MSFVDVEKLKMTGAGRALAVLTSGGDAQGHYKLKHIVLKSLKTHEVMLFCSRDCLDKHLLLLLCCFFFFLFLRRDVLNTVKVSVVVKGRVGVL